MSTNHEMVKATQVMRVSQDDASNPLLAAEVSGLRGVLYSNLPDVPSRYTISPHQDKPRIIVHDLRDGREPAEVSICNAHGFIEALVWFDLVGEEAPVRVELEGSNSFIRYQNPSSGESTDVKLCDLRGFHNALDWLGF